jgi:hypothetical protein
MAAFLEFQAAAMLELRPLQFWGVATYELVVIGVLGQPTAPSG